jgi:hypothetical protein
MADPFRSPKRRLARVKHHISQLERDIKRVFSGDLLKQERVIEFVGIQKALVVKFRQVRDIPDELGDLAVDAIDGIRSALDQSCAGSATALGVEHPRKAYFPFADTKEQLENVIKGNCKELHPDICDLLRTFEPYEDGNKLLWSLNQVRRRNQHHVLAEVGLGAGAFHLNAVEPDRVGPFGMMIRTPQWDREKREVHVIHTDPTTTFRALDIDVEFYPALGNAGVLTGEPVIPVLHKLTGEAERIVMAIEAETTRILRERGR